MLYTQGAFRTLSPSFRPHRWPTGSRLLSAAGSCPNHLFAKEPTSSRARKEARPALMLFASPRPHTPRPSSPADGWCCLALSSLILTEGQGQLPGPTATPIRRGETAGGSATRCTHSPHAPSAGAGEASGHPNSLPPPPSLLLLQAASFAVVSPARA